MTVTDPPSWEMISRVVANVCADTLALLIAISYFRKQQPRRGLLLAGALTMVPLNLFWNFASLWRDFYLRIITVLSDKLNWVGATATLLFSVTLLLIAMDRRNQERRIEELEAILRDRDGTP